MTKQGAAELAAKLSGGGDDEESKIVVIRRAGFEAVWGWWWQHDPSSRPQRRILADATGVDNASGESAARALPSIRGAGRMTLALRALAKRPEPAAAAATAAASPRSFIDDAPKLPTCKVLEPDRTPEAYWDAQLQFVQCCVDGLRGGFRFPTIVAVLEKVRRRTVKAQERCRASRAAAGGRRGLARLKGAVRLGAAAGAFGAVSRASQSPRKALGAQAHSMRPEQARVPVQLPAI